MQVLAILAIAIAAVSAAPTTTAAEPWASHSVEEMHDLYNIYESALNFSTNADEGLSKRGRICPFEDCYHDCINIGSCWGLGCSFKELGCYTGCRAACGW